MTNVRDASSAATRLVSQRAQLCFMTGKPSGFIQKRQRQRQRDLQRLAKIKAYKKEIARLNWFLGRCDPQTERGVITATHKKLRTLNQQVRYMGGE